MKRIALKQMIEAMDGRLVGYEDDKEICVEKVVIDSRKASEDAMYVAIVGERVDGHDYIKSAFDNGAVLALAEDEAKVPEGYPTILVNNTVIALGKLAAYYRTMFDIPFIGITGSVGKTSTKDMIASILSTKYKVHKTDGNYNNDIGLPLTLLGLEREHEVAVIEMGMNHFGEIDYLANILKPDVGVITNIGISHIEFLGSREGILKAKSEMLPHVSEQGLIVLNGDDDMLKTLTNKYGRRMRTFGHEESCDCRIVNHVHFANGQHIDISTTKKVYHMDVDYPGEHLLFNALPGVVIAEHYGLDEASIVKGIKGYKPSKMRLQQYDVNGQIRILDDAYNASVESMESAMKTLLAIKRDDERAVAILGSMFEMGDYAESGHSSVGQKVAQIKPDILLTAGEEAKIIYNSAIQNGFSSDRAYCFEDRDSLVDVIDDIVKKGDLILLKASRGMMFEKIREHLIRKFEG